MDVKRSPWILGIGAAALTAGCAQVPLNKAQAPAPAAGPKVEAVYRVQQPAGTAAGQYAVGRIDLAEGRVGAAVKRFQQALQLDPGFVEAHNGLGVAYGQQGRYAEAASAFRAALALSPESPHVLNNLGLAQLKAGQLEDAAASLNRSLALDARNERTRENLSLLAAARTAVASALASAATSTGPATADTARSAPPAVAVSAAPVVPAVASSASVAAAPAVAGLAPSASAASAPASAASVVPAAPPPRPPLTIQPVAVPQVVTRPAFEVVVSRSSESALVQVAPNVYELRQGEAVAATPAGETVAAVPQPPTPEPIAMAPVVAQPLAKSPQPDVSPAQAKAAESEPPKAQQAQVLQPPPVTQFSLAARPLTAAKRPATTVSLGGLEGLEVSNGVGIRHLAGRTARSLSQLGVPVARVSDYRLFGRQRTEIHYRSGHVDQAMAVRTSLPVGARLVRTDRLHPSVNVRLVIGKDLVERQVAWLGDESMTAELGSNGDSSVARVARELDLEPLAAVVARANVNNGWRYL